MASILIIDDEPTISSAFAMFFRQHGGHVVTEAHTGEEGIAAWSRMRPDVTLLDVKLPDLTGFEVLERLRAQSPVVIMITGHGDVPMAVKALQSGAENFLTKPVDLALLQFAVERGLEKASLRRLNRHITESRGAASVTMGSSPMMRELWAQIQALAAADKTTGLILGESGTGKGRVAELIHATSPRSARPFVDVNCGALTLDSLDEELFGTSGDTEGNGEARHGRIEIAEGGTLFLDEIGDLDPQIQPKLIRVLEGKSFRRVGGSQDIMSNVRVLAATSKDLVTEVTGHRFREELYYRLSVMPVVLPPLRARTREDLVELVSHILNELSPRLSIAPHRISEEALEHILRYSWPGNIRELRNVLERALLLARVGHAIEAAHLPAEVRGASGGLVDHHVAKLLSDVERAHIDRTLRAHGNNRTRAAKELGISRATLINKIRDFQIGEQGR